MIAVKTMEGNSLKKEEAKEWLLCPVCHSKTRTMLRKDTLLKNFPLFCPKCKRESVVNASNGIVTISKEPDAKT